MALDKSDISILRRLVEKEYHHTDDQDKKRRLSALYGRLDKLNATSGSGPRAVKTVDLSKVKNNIHEIDEINNLF